MQPPRSTIIPSDQMMLAGSPSGLRKSPGLRNIWDVSEPATICHFAEEATLGFSAWTGGGVDGTEGGEGREGLGSDGGEGGLGSLGRDGAWAGVTCVG